MRKRAGRLSVGKLWLAVGPLVLLALPFTFIVSPPSADARPLDQVDQLTLQRAEKQGRSYVTMLIAAKPDQIKQVAAGVRSVGGSVSATEGRIDYVKARVPVDAAARVANLKAVEAVDIDRTIPLDDPRVKGNSPAQPQSPPDSSTPRANPYMPVQDTGAAAFGETPARDGRGVKVAVLDSGIDLAHPALRTTSNSQPKVIDWFDAIPPAANMGSWVATEGRVSGTFTRVGQTWVAPATGGPYAFGRLREDAGDLALGLLGGDLDRNGVTGEFFGVLQDRVTKEVYVDTNKNRDFTDDAGPMLDYGLDQDRSFFGVDDPETPLREQIAFSVGTSRSEYPDDSDVGSWVNIGVTGADHGTHVAGIIGATGMFGGEMSGAAPGAQLISVKVCPTSGGCSAAAMLDGMIYAAESGADLANLSVGGLPAMNDGDNARAELYNRLIGEFGMQIFISAGNSGAGVNTVGDPAVASDSIAVAATVTRESWLANYGQVNETENGLFTFSSRGPSESGAMKPDLAAPGSAVSTTFDWANGAAVDGIYQLPPGYSMFNGTSMSSPQAAGAAALLVGAYRHEFGHAPEPAALRNALISTADFLPDAEALGQGAGLIAIDAAWQQLRQEQSAGRSRITASVAVNSVLSPRLRVPGQGVGIYEREGLQADDDLTRTYTFTRTSGPPGTVEFEVDWVGNDGTFSSASSVVLPLDTPTEFPVRIQPAGTGIHSALLRIDDPGSTGIDLTTQNVIFATTPSQGITVTESGTVGRGDAERMLIDVPPGTTGLNVEMDAGGTESEKGQVRFLMVHPEGTLPEEMGSRQCFNPANPEGCPVGSPTNRTITNPAPGVWEILIESFRGSSVQQAPYTVTAGLLQARISPDPDVVRARSYIPVSRTYETTNHGAAFTGRMVGGPLSSTRNQRRSISGGGNTQISLSVLAGTESLEASIGNPVDADSDLDLFLFDCTTGNCTLARQSTSAGADETVRFNNPAAGTWVVLVDGYSVPSGNTDYDYMDSLTSAALYGELTVEDSDSVRTSGQRWSADATFDPAASPDLGTRQLTGKVELVTSTGNLVTDADVNFTIDTDPPETSFTETPATPGRNASPRFAFESDEPGTFRCSLDEEPYSECESPLTLGPLEDGPHTLSVYAVDSALNDDPTPATFEFEIDTRQPVVTFTAGPDPVGTDRNPKFEFTADKPGSTFECQLDESTWEPCSSGFTATDLDDGEHGAHVFTVKATDGLGNSGSASHEFTITAPTSLTATSTTGAWKGTDLELAVSATLTHARTGDPVSGRTVEFSVAGAPLCAATTDNKGTAQCAGSLAERDAKGDRYSAIFEGEPQFAAGSAEGQLSIPDRPDPVPVCPAIKLGMRLSGFDPRPPFGSSRRIPGLRVKLATGKAFHTKIRPRIRYRVSGKVKRVRLKTRSLRFNGTRQLRFRIPTRMKRDYRRAGKRLRGSAVALVIGAELRQKGAPVACSQRAQARVRTRVVGVAGRAGLRHLKPGTFAFKP